MIWYIVIAIFMYILGLRRGRWLAERRYGINFPAQLRYIKSSIDDKLRGLVALGPDNTFHFHFDDEALNFESNRDAAEVSVALGEVIDRFVPYEHVHE